MSGSAFHAKLTRGACVVLIDNVYVECSSTPISRTDADGNTYQRRRLTDGSEYEIMKNFPTEAQLREMLGPNASHIDHVALTYFWCVSYRVAGEERNSNERRPR